MVTTFRFGAKGIQGRGSQGVYSILDEEKSLKREEKRAKDREYMRLQLSDPAKRAEIMRKKAERRAQDPSIRAREYAKRKEIRAADAGPRKKAEEIAARIKAVLKKKRVRLLNRQEPVMCLPLFVYGRKEKAKLRFRQKYADESFRAYSCARKARWKEANPEKVMAWSKTEKARQGRARIAKKPENRLMQSIRCRMKDVVKQCSRGLVTSGVRKAIGCSSSFLKMHLESMFKPGMSWINYGEWHVDHIIPLAKAKGNAAIAMSLNHWTNLRPLWAQENIKKGGTMDYDADMRVRA